MNIIAFAGKKGSGKNTLCNFLHGYFMKMHGVIDSFDIADSGDLIIETDIIQEDGTLQKGKGPIDIKRLDLEFAMWAANNMWPIIKHYAFATPVKEIAVELFSLNKELVHGSNEDKNSLTEYKWEDMPFKTKKTGFLTIREFLQIIATEIFRKIHEDVWANRAIKDIEIETPLLATVSDLRFPNELAKINEKGGKTVFLTGGYSDDEHSSETSFNQMTFDAVIDTANQTIDESCHQLIDLMTGWGIIPKEIVIANQEKKSRGVSKIK